MANPLQENGIGFGDKGINAVKPQGLNEVELKQFLWGQLSRITATWLVVAFILDQATKWYVLAVVDLDQKLNIPVAPFFDFTMGWNRGVSYSLFASHEQGFLIGLSLVLSAVLWAWSCKNSLGMLSATGFGLIIGGALGNVVDRIRHGAVADFLHFFWHNWSWYIFNMADVAITVGVVLLLYESFTMNDQKQGA
jgi:signal peptidase II